MVRGMVFGFGAAARATAASLVSVKRGSTLVSILLIVTGTLMVIVGVVSTRELELNLVSSSYNLSSSGILDNCARNSDECENKVLENNIF